MTGANFGAAPTLDNVHTGSRPQMLNRHLFQTLRSDEQFTILDPQDVIKFTGGALDDRFTGWHERMAP